MPDIDSVYISEFSSLNFRHDWSHDFQMRTCYVQQFLPSDNIRVQAARLQSGLIVSFRIVDLFTNTSFTPKVTEYLSSDYIVYDIVPGKALDAGMYRFEILKGVNVASYSEFVVVNELTDTVLLSATHYRNEFDAIFQDGQVFEFRLPAFFPQSENLFKADTEDFRDQRYTIRQLSSTPYEVETLAIGGEYGVPNWVGRKVNMYFSLSSTFIDGVRYVRSDGDTPNVEVINALYPLFRYKIAVEKENTFSLYTDRFNWAKV